MKFEITLVNGRTFIYEDQEVKEMEDLSMILNSKEYKLPNTNIKTSDIMCITKVNPDSRKLNNLRRITSISEEFALSNSNKSKEGYVIPIFVEAKIDEDTGNVSNINFDEVKKEILKRL